MSSKRTINHLHSIFDLSICKNLHLLKLINTRAILDYGISMDKKSIKILGDEITKEMSDKLSLWLEVNEEADDILRNIRSEQIDIDEFRKHRGTGHAHKIIS